MCQKLNIYLLISNNPLIVKMNIGHYEFVDNWMDLHFITYNGIWPDESSVSYRNDIYNILENIESDKVIKYSCISVKYGYNYVKEYIDKNINYTFRIVEIGPVASATIRMNGLEVYGHMGNDNEICIPERFRNDDMDKLLLPIVSMIDDKYHIRLVKAVIIDETYEPHDIEGDISYLDS